jgi:hypothetical protein
MAGSANKGASACNLVPPRANIPVAAMSRWRLRMLEKLPGGKLPKARVVHPLVVRITHWINAFAMLCMITSGWKI